MISKIEDQHLERQAYVYLRQSTPGQVLHNQESTERQYALKDKALELGWPPTAVRTLDQDLGVSGAQIAGRKDFKILVSDVALGKVGAVLALEASRLARSSLDSRCPMNSRRKKTRDSTPKTIGRASQPARPQSWLWAPNNRPSSTTSWAWVPVSFILPST